MKKQILRWLFDYAFERIFEGIIVWMREKARETPEKWDNRMVANLQMYRNEIRRRVWQWLDEV